MTREPQRGAALLLAMMIVALVATLATAMIWQQWRAVQIESIERARSQSAWILGGARAWAKRVIREDRNQAGGDHLGEVWAVPLAEARLSTFLAADKENTDGGPEAFLSGSIVDAQARFNLRNLVMIDAATNTAKRVKEQADAFLQLCKGLGISVDAADRIIAGMVQAYAPVPVPTAPLQPHSVGQLAWMGIDTATIARLEPYAIVLPGTVVTKININTAPAEVIAAAAQIDPSHAVALVQARARKPFGSLSDAQTAAGLQNPLSSALFDVGTLHFEVRGRLRLDRRILEEVSLVRRTAPGTVATEVDRHRGSLQEIGP